MGRCCDLRERVGDGAGPGELGPARDVAEWVCQVARARIPRADHAEVAWQAWLRVVRACGDFTLAGGATPRGYVQRLAAHESAEFWGRRGFWTERRAPGEAPLPRDPEKRRAARAATRRPADGQADLDDAAAPTGDDPARVVLDDELSRAIRDCLETRVPEARRDEFREWAVRRDEKGHAEEMARARGIRGDTFRKAMAGFLERMRECLEGKGMAPS